MAPRGGNKNSKVDTFTWNVVLWCRSLQSALIFDIPVLQLSNTDQNSQIVGIFDIRPSGIVSVKCVGYLLVHLYEAYMKSAV